MGKAAGENDHHHQTLLGAKRHVAVKSVSSISMKRAKKRMHMKGASQLDPRERKRYDTRLVADPSAKASKKMDKAGGVVPSPSGDGDIWVEKIFRHRETGETHVFFVSNLTGRRAKQEPPSGASRVMYLRQSYKKKTEKKYSIQTPVVAAEKHEGASHCRMGLGCISCIVHEDQTIPTDKPS